MGACVAVTVTAAAGLSDGCCEQPARTHNSTNSKQNHMILFMVAPLSLALLYRKIFGGTRSSHDAIHALKIWLYSSAHRPAEPQDRAVVLLTVRPDSGDQRTASSVGGLEQVDIGVSHEMAAQGATGKQRLGNEKLSAYLRYQIAFLKLGNKSGSTLCKKFSMKLKNFPTDVRSFVLQ